MNKIDEERIGGKYQKELLKDFIVFAASRMGSRFCRAHRYNIWGRPTCGRICTFVDL